MLPQSLLVATSISAAFAISINRRAAITDFDTSPINFSFPPGRTFNATTATTAPCGGSPAGVRADYPLTGGDISLTSKTLLDTVNILWTNETDPTRFHAFSTYTDTLSELGSGHYCQPAPDFASFGLKAGDDVTLMIMYNLEGVSSNYYYCADINLVSAEGFTPSEQYMCSNLTSSLQVASAEDSMQVGTTSATTSSGSTSDNASESSTPGATEAVSQNSGLSAAAGGGIGAAVTIVVIASLAAAAYVCGFVRFGKKRAVVLADHASDSTGVPIKAAQF